MYDLAIIGAGPAGLSASVYASRYGVKNIVIGEIGGGLTSETHEIGNWLGTEKISGADFGKQAQDHVLSYGAEISLLTVTSITKLSDSFELILSSGQKILAKTILLTTGTKHRHLDIPGEVELLGRGVSYCATCDGYFYRNKTVAVIGGGNSAAAAAVHLGNLAAKVYLLYRGPKLKAEQAWLKAIDNNPKIEIMYNVVPKQFLGQGYVTGLVIEKTGESEQTLALDGIFVEIGLDPNISLINTLSITTDEGGYIVIDEAGKTNVAGIWAAGDVTTGSNKFKQIITAASEGAIAAQDIAQSLNV